MNNEQYLKDSRLRSYAIIKKQLKRNAWRMFKMIDFWTQNYISNGIYLG